MKKIDKKRERIETLLTASYGTDYIETPVSMRKFLIDTDFLGFGTKQGKMVYPVWMDVLSDLSNSPEKNLPIFSGAIGCLGPDVKVSLLDGRELSIPEIIEERKKGEQHWVYSYDIERGKIVPGKVVGAMLSGNRVDKIVEVELDTGEKILCTPNHPFLMSSGEYKQASCLLSDDSLMPLNRMIGSMGYELIWTRSYKQRRGTFRIVAEEVYGDTPKGSCIHHHPEGGKRDNSPENLKVMTVEEHIKLHSVELNPFRNIPGFASECAKKQNKERWGGMNGKQHRKEAGDRLKKRNKETGQAKKAGESRWSKNVEEQKKKLREEMIERNEKGQAKKANQTRWSKPKARENQSEKMKKWWEDNDHKPDCTCGRCKLKRGELKGENHPMYGKPAWNRKPRKTKTCALPKCTNTFEVMIGGKDENRRFCSVRCSNKSRKNCNHKVVSVKYHSERIDVYDLSVEKYHNFALTSGVFVHNTGKTSAAIWGMAYVMQVILCLKDPWSFFGKASGGKMAVVFFNLTQSLGSSRGFGLLQSYLLKSPWFKERGRILGSEQNPRIDFPIFEYVSGSPYAKGFGVQGHDIITALMDEVDSPSESDKQRVRVLKAFEAGYRRFENRFVIRSQIDDRRLTLGKFFLVASKQEQLSFLNTFIAKMKNSPNVYIVDIPVWEAKDPREYCGIKFPIMIGDLYTPSKVLGQGEGKDFEPNQEAVETSVQNGFKVMQIPIEYLDAFQLDIVGALRDFAGVSIAGMRKTKLFPSEKLLVDCYDPAKRNPIKKLTIEVGLQDDVNFAEYIDFSAIRVPRHIPRYIHVDIAYSGDGDALGLGMSCISGWTDRTVEDLEDGGLMKVEKLPVVETDFGMRIKGKPGDKIPLNKVRKLIVDLKRVYHFNIRLVTLDLALLSEETKQILTRVGIENGSLSLDRSPQIYRNFRELAHDKRWCCHRDEYLHFELSNLEDDPDRNKVDHPDEVVDIEILKDGNTREVVLKGSKDESDGVVGSVENALRSSGAPPSKEFVDSVKKVIPQLHDDGKERALLSLSGIPTPLPKKEEDDISEESLMKFKSIFDKSQKKL